MKAAHPMTRRSDDMSVNDKSESRTTPAGYLKAECEDCGRLIRVIYDGSQVGRHKCRGDRWVAYARVRKS